MRNVAFSPVTLSHHIRALGYYLVDHGDATLCPRRTGAARSANTSMKAYLRESLWRTLAHTCRGGFPVILGATTPSPYLLSQLFGTLPGKGARGRLDMVRRHADINSPETSPSGNVHGMPLQRSSASATND